MQGNARKQRITLFLGIKPTAGGMYQYGTSVLLALDRLDKNRFEVLAIYTDPQWRLLLDGLKVSSCYVPVSATGQFMSDILCLLPFPQKVIQWLARQLNPMARVLSAMGSDIWVFPGQETLGFQLKGRLVASIHDLMHRYERHHGDFTLLRYLYREARFSKIARYADIILVDSEVGKSHVLESYRINAGKIETLPYIAPAYIYNAPEMPSDDLRRKLPDRFFFYPAQFWPHKNHKRLLQALQIASKECPDMALVFSGHKRQNYKQILAYAEQLGLSDRVSFIGYVEAKTVGWFYRQAVALVMPTFFGPTNIPPLEAIVCGCPVAVSGIYGMPEQLGKASLYFDPYSTEEIAQCLSQLWQSEEKRAELIQQGQEWLKDKSKGDFFIKIPPLIENLADHDLTT